MALVYCKKCGRVVEGVDYNGHQDPNCKCDCCGSQTYPVPEKYWLDGLDFLITNDSEKLLREELVKTSSEFDQYLFDNREKILREKAPPYIVNFYTENGELKTQVIPNPDKRNDGKKLEDIKMPSPPGMIDFLPLFLIFLLFGLFCLILPSPFNIIGLLLFLITGICMGSSNYNSAKKDYHLALTNFEQYQKEKLREQQEIERQHELERQRKAMKVVSPKCPYCGSYNTSKIGAISRGVSVGLLGLASSKIGKQWHCKDCSSDF